jgi:proteasome assembly chaperone (PAC2) family protein
MSSEFTLYREPNLRNPRLVVGLPDVGYVGLRVIDYLRAKLGAGELGRIEPHRFSTVPWVSVSNGVLRDLELLRNGFYFWKNPGAGNDIVIFRSEQPTARPYDFVEVILEAARHIGVKRIYVVGSFGALGMTHREAPSVLGVVNMPRLTRVLEEAGVDPYPEYKGIGSIHSSFLWFARSRGIEGVGLWSPMPHYVARLPFPWSNYPMSALCLVRKLNAMEGLGVDEEELDLLARRTEEEMGQIYDQLQEEAKNEMVYPSTERRTSYPEQGLGKMSDEDLKGMIKDIEDFFRKRKQ